jgi:hypothetical protein
LVSATDPGVKVELPFYGKLSVSIDLADVPRAGAVPDIPSTADITESVKDPSSSKCQFLDTPCREMAELAAVFASGDRDTAVEAIKAKVKELAKKKAAEIAHELKKKALCTKGIGSDCPETVAAAAADQSAATPDVGRQTTAASSPASSRWARLTGSMTSATRSAGWPTATRTAPTSSPTWPSRTWRPRS